MLKIMANVMGPPVEGDDFYGRKEELTYIIKKLIDGNHILLSAPRRVGKTSLALRVLHLLKKENWEGVFVDVEGAQNELMVVQEIIKAIERNKSLWKKVGNSITGLLKNIDVEIVGGVGKIKLGSTKAEQANNLLEKLGEILIKIDHPFILIIDELPVFLIYLEKQKNGKERVRNFLHRLRAYRITAYGTDRKEKALAWFFCGSIGLENYTFLNNLSSTINDLMPYQIGAYSESEAVGFIKLLCRQESKKIDQENINYFLQKTGWPIPYYLRLIFEEIVKADGNSQAILKENIDLAYEQAIHRNKSVLDLWIQRLKEQLTQSDYEIAHHMLSQIAQSYSRDFNELKAFFMKKHGDNLSLNESLGNLIDLLLNEGYLVKENEKYTFRSPFVKDWWKLKNHL